VYPFFESERVPSDALPPILPRLHALIVGPGLSRNKAMLQGSLNVIQEAQKLRVPLVIDADGLVLVQEHPEVFTGYHPTVLTPNLNEFKRLCGTFVSIFFCIFK
jgi:ATP-dependent NAD(P)H-hydrate dehydratase